MAIFLSYASEDREIAELITFAMRARGHDVFLDKDDLPAGESYEDKIERAIKSSDLFIFLISKASLSSGRYTLTEASIARRHWKSPQNRVLPVMIEQMDYSKVPAFFRSVSILEPHGDPAAEVCAEAAQILNVTNENKLPLANFLRRFLSSAIDSIFLFLFFIGISYSYFTDIPEQAESIGLTILIKAVSFSAIIGFYTVSLIYLNGTPGDRFFKLKVIDEATGKGPSPLQAIIWTFTYMALFYVSWICYFFDEKKRMLHNIASRTLVVSESEDDSLEQISSKTYDVLKKKVKSGDFQADFKKFQQFLDEIKPDRNTRFEASNNQAPKNQHKRSPANITSWRLSGSSEEGAQFNFILKPPAKTKTTWVLGRQQDETDFLIDQTRISRKHAEFRFDPERGLAIRDLNSTNGSYVNGKKISANWNLLKIGDRIDIGSARLVLSAT